MGIRTGVGRSAVALRSARIGHSDTFGIMPEAVGSDRALRAPGLDRAVKAYQIVVADLVESSLAVPAVYICRADVA